MALTIHVNGSSNSLAHKGSSGIAKCTPPDVCKTPSPAGPVPIPYPVIISMASDLENGTTTVEVDGGNMAAIKDSDLSRCTGDEPGTAGGVVSSTNMKEAKWILYSFDVMLEGKNACRLSDKLTMNHANTACLGGWLQLPVIKGATAEEKVACAIYCCDRADYKQAKGKKAANRCARLGKKKHACVNHALKKHKADNPGDPVAQSIDTEKAFPPSMQSPSVGRVLKPDVKFGPNVIDAKFEPCQQPVKWGERFKHPTAPGRMWNAPLPPKEKDYFSIKGVKKVNCMTPDDADDKRDKTQCDCKVAQSRRSADVR
jgi:hypothetical protein